MSFALMAVAQLYLEFIWYALKKKDANIQNVFQKCICSIAAPQIRRLLPRIGRFLPKKQKASSEECWAHTHISFETWCSFAYGSLELHLHVSSGAVFMTAKQHSSGNGFCNRVSFLLMHTVTILLKSQ